MKLIYSKVEPDKLLHIIVRKSDLTPGRTEVVSGEHFIQCALLNMEEGKTFQPHKHIWKNRTRDVIALVYEYKTGPYEGQQLDKVFLDKIGDSSDNK